MEPNLTGVQRQQLWQILLAAFPTHESLEEMVSFQLNQNLDAIAGGANLSEVVLNLIRWAEAEDRVTDLIAGAHTANPGNADLAAFATQWATIRTAAPGTVVVPVLGRPVSPVITGLVAIPVLLVVGWLVFFPPWRASGPAASSTATPLPATATLPRAPSATTVPPTTTVLSVPTVAPSGTAAPAPPSATPPPAARACATAQDCMNAGSQYQAAQDWHAAIAEFNRAIQLDPNFADAYDGLGYAYDRIGSYDQAIQAYEQAIALDAHNPLYYYNRGSTYYRVAQVRDAPNPSRQTIDYHQVIADMTQALNLHLTGLNAYAYFFRGASYVATGDPTHARPDLTKAADLCVATDPGLCREVDAAMQALPSPTP